MIDEIKSVLEFLLVFDFGIVCAAIPAFVVYPIVRRLLKNEWRNLFCWVDIPSYIVVHAIWLYGLVHDFNNRGAGMFLDIVVIGVEYGVLVLLRIPFVWRHPEWRTRIAAISLVLLVVAAITLTWIVNLAECAD